jgi:hypothetical protein
MDIPKNFDYDNFLDMALWTLVGVMGLIDNKHFHEAKEKCREAVRTIERLKDGKK